MGFPGITKGSVVVRNVYSALVPHTLHEAHGIGDYQIILILEVEGLGSVAEKGYEKTVVTANQQVIQNAGFDLASVEVSPHGLRFVKKGIYRGLGEKFH